MPNTLGGESVEIVAVNNAKVPTEVEILILDHLRNDHAALKRCILTCRAWVPLIRPLLFCRIVLRRPESCDRLKALVRAGHGALVQDLVIWPTMKTVTGQMINVNWLLELEDLLPHLPQVAELHLNSFCVSSAKSAPKPYATNFAHLSKTLTKAICTSFPNLRTLALSDFRIDDAQLFSLCLGTHSLLTDIRLEGILVITNHLPDSPTLLHQSGIKPVIRELTFVDHFSPAKQEVADIVFPIIDLRLDYLCWIAEPKDDEQRVLGSVLAKSASVKRLHVQLIGHYSGDYEYVPDALKGVRLTNLEQVFLATVCHERPGPMIQWCSSLLERIHSPALQTIVFCLVLFALVGDEPRNIPPLDWKAIDTQLLRLQTLRSDLVVMFCVPAGDDRVPNNAWISAFLREMALRLPGACAAGIPIGFKNFRGLNKPGSEVRMTDFDNCAPHWAPRCS